MFLKCVYIVLNKGISNNQEIRKIREFIDITIQTRKPRSRTAVFNHVIAILSRRSYPLASLDRILINVLLCRSRYFRCPRYLVELLTSYIRVSPWTKTKVPNSSNFRWFMLVNFCRSRNPTTTYLTLYFWKIVRVASRSSDS
jgi:hypothetical protein